MEEDGGDTEVTRGEKHGQEENPSENGRRRAHRKGNPQPSNQRIVKKKSVRESLETRHIPGGFIRTGKMTNPEDTKNVADRLPDLFVLHIRRVV
ncbi:hypothetical protein NDU88_006658 [Pleurodeles waltl]|uniref:Uncharacterized protein n=1 Tax=Pleurodeles waltl TaxID=8319 RepID=A0AAV7WBD8_PLEWA|nr:hypothetical protein NDU88_006658 [Pleurodeles waltl]